MSITEQITRIQTDRNTMRTKLVDLGLVQSTADLDDIANAVEGIENRGAVSATVQEGATYTIPKGYHNGSGTVSGIKGGGNYSLQSKSVTPTKAQQNITPDSGYYGLSDVTVNAIPENYQDVSSVTAESGDVLANKIIVDKTGKQVAGTMPNNGAVTKTIDTSTTSYTIPAGYHSGTGKVSVATETKSATPTKSKQEIVATSGKVLSKVTVNPIPNEYQDVSGVTATAEKVLEGSTFVDAEGNEVEGTMVNHLSTGTYIRLTPKDPNYTVPEGYHPLDNTTVEALSMTREVTPTKQTQIIDGSTWQGGGGVDKVFLSQVTVKPIPDNYQDISTVTATADKVLEGEVFVDSDGYEVDGQMPNIGTVSRTLSATTSNQSYTIPKGYHSGSGTVSITLEEKSTTPTKSAQTITPTSGKVLSKVTVAAIPANYITTTDANATAADILVDKSAYVNGSKVTGSMANNGAYSNTIDGLTVTSITIPAGYHSGSGKITLTNDIETALAAI